MYPSLLFSPASIYSQLPTLSMTYDFLRNNPGWGLALLVVALSLALLLFRRPHTKHSKLPLPPGPRPIPFLGTLQEFPLRPSRLRELHQKYGRH